MEKCSVFPRLVRITKATTNGSVCIWVRIVRQLTIKHTNSQQAWVLWWQNGGVTDNMNKKKKKIGNNINCEASWYVHQTNAIPIPFFCFHFVCCPATWICDGSRCRKYIHIFSHPGSPSTVSFWAVLRWALHPNRIFSDSGLIALFFYIYSVVLFVSTLHIIWNGYFGGGRGG